MARSIYLIRHGETEWSRSGKHTSTTDLPLTEAGVAACEPLRTHFAKQRFDHVFSSPMQRAHTTAALVVDQPITTTPALIEWQYGEYEGITTPQIRETDPAWNLWTDGCPGGESPEEITERLQQFLKEIEQIDGTVACFAHGHVLCALAALWVNPDVSFGQHLHLNTATVSLLDYHHDNRVILQWNSPVK